MINKLADAFSVKLQEEIGADKVREAIWLNRREPCPDVCHSHDFCDANMVMSKAFLEVVGKDVPESDEESRAWNEAWDLAKSRGFCEAVLPSCITAEIIRLASDLPEVMAEAEKVDDLMEGIIWMTACSLAEKFGLTDGQRDALAGRICWRLDLVDES